MNSSHEPGPEPPPHPTRPRAPTITIDESAITGAPETSVTPTAERPASLPRLQTDGLETQPKPPSTFTESPSDIKGRPADHGSRPTSPHNVSSPTHQFLDGAAAHNFLTVPGARSR